MSVQYQDPLFLRARYLVLRKGRQENRDSIS